MRLPNWEKAIILSPKLRGYLLSAEHPHGRFKARFFARFGFAADSWQVLAEALKVHAATHEVLSFEDTPFGTRYTVEGQINAPDGRRPRIRSVWFIARREEIPRFVTAYPLARRGR